MLHSEAEATLAVYEAGGRMGEGKGKERLEGGRRGGGSAEGVACDGMHASVGLNRRGTRVVLV